MKRLGLIVAFAIPLAAAGPFVKVRVSSGGGSTVIDLPAERYVAGVLAGESSVFRSDSALRAMALAARTYAVRLRGRHSAEGFDFCSSTHCQRVDLKSITPRLESIAEETAGELVWFRGRPAFTPYSRACGGQTENAAALWPDLASPYLKSHNDEWCRRAGVRPWQWSGDPVAIVQALVRSGLRVPRKLAGISIAKRTASGRAAVLTLIGAGESLPVSAGSFRLAVARDLGWNSIASEFYEVKTGGGRLEFQGRGSGHGIGLCQSGADQMGTEGRTYRDILAFYYPGTAVGVTAQGLSWQRLGGATLALWTTEPQRDGGVLAIAEREMHGALERTAWQPPRGADIRVYPDVDSFRNATGEPGWVAAYTSGRHIHLQPVAVLRSRGALESTLRHESMHLLLESRAAPELPIWFREGLAGYLAGSRTRPTGAVPPEVRRAYSDSIRVVTGLAQRYGEATVLGWVSAGLPPDVRNASSNHAATNSR
ncbi:MAG: SpoIID/LytB domain-containing protein [Bryobacteraceae bacterium]